MYKGWNVNKPIICIAIALKYPINIDGVTAKPLKLQYSINKKTYIAFLFNKKDVGSHY